MNIIYPDGMYMRPLGIAGDFGAFGGSSNDKVMALLMLVPIVLPAIIVDIPLSLAADVVFLPVSIPAELWWFSQNEGTPDELEAPGGDEFKDDLEGLPSIEDVEKAAEEAQLIEE